MLLATNNVLTPRNVESKILPLGIQSQLVQIQNINKIPLDDSRKIARRKLLEKAEVSVSSYDTAWVAMVPSKESKEKPLFPECLEWVMENQQPDGSWCPNPWHPLLVKDSLSATLACVLALHKWNLANSLVKRGLEYIDVNCWAATDDRQLTPTGFDITFPAMIELAIESGLKLNLDPHVVDILLQNRDNELMRADLEETKGNIAYLLEGIGKQYDWEELINYQRSNGSFFNSPSATAAALCHINNEQCYNYLTCLLKKFNNAAPTVYPLEIYSQLCIIDNLQKLGIDRYCRSEIEGVLDNIYGLWLQRDEEIVLDVNCCAIGFRLLRMNGYDVSSEILTQFSQEEKFFNSVSPQFKNTNTILELFKASKIMIHQTETILQKIESWTGSFLKQLLLSGDIRDSKLREEVDHALRYRYDSLELIETRWNIEHQKKDTSIQLLKTSYRSINDDNDDILALAIQEYNKCQCLYQQEYRYLERWVKDCRFDELKFARIRLLSCYYTNTAVLVAPELADARVIMTKNCILATVFDDFFDVAGSREELENLIQLVEMWGEASAIGYCSEQVKIIFSAFEDMIKEIDAIAFKHHGRSIEHHLLKIWLDLLMSMMKEAEWAGENATPTLDEYMEKAYVSFALGPICHLTTYFLGITLPEEVMAGPEIYNLYKLVSLVGRLHNDLKSFEREREEGKYNSVLLRELYSQGTMTEEEAVAETKRDIEKYRIEMLKLVVQKKDSSLPRVFRDFFWKSCNMMHYFYRDDDGYSYLKTDMANDAKALLWEPITLH